MSDYCIVLFYHIISGISFFGTLKKLLGQIIFIIRFSNIFIIIDHLNYLFKISHRCRLYRFSMFFINISDFCYPTIGYGKRTFRARIIISYILCSIFSQ